ncbi:MAG TPA: hypothetical protein PKD64_11290 [Pirellulaceae bacterium]|nr:hypothetical protein [Pirellulaceae bacterium]HMO92766.1 hypothetical protein [Pirellulaceae bacterium]HMP69348.1 hypothetical protein [Pirellulaceae bacterium]
MNDPQILNVWFKILEGEQLSQAEEDWLNLQLDDSAELREQILGDSELHYLLYDAFDAITAESSIPLKLRSAQTHCRINPTESIRNRSQLTFARKCALSAGFKLNSLQSDLENGIAASCDVEADHAENRPDFDHVESTSFRIELGTRRKREQEKKGIPQWVFWCCGLCIASFIAGILTSLSYFGGEKTPNSLVNRISQNSLQNSDESIEDSERVGYTDRKALHKLLDDSVASKPPEEKLGLTNSKSHSVKESNEVPNQRLVEAQSGLTIPKDGQRDAYRRTPHVNNYHTVPLAGGTLFASRDAVWQLGFGISASGMRRFELAEGKAEFENLNGTLVRLRAPAILEIESDGKVHILQGDAYIALKHLSDAVITPEASFTNGTDTILMTSIQPEKGTAVRVLQGSVLAGAWGRTTSVPFELSHDNLEIAQFDVSWSEQRLLPSCAFATGKTGTFRGAIDVAGTPLVTTSREVFDDMWSTANRNLAGGQKDFVDRWRQIVSVANDVFAGEAIIGQVANIDAPGDILGLLRSASNQHTSPTNMPTNDKSPGPIPTEDMLGLAQEFFQKIDFGPNNSFNSIGAMSTDVRVIFEDLQRNLVHLNEMSKALRESHMNESRIRSEASKDNLSESRVAASLPSVEGLAERRLNENKLVFEQLGDLQRSFRE